jgi:hypothetical protein
VGVDHPGAVVVINNLVVEEFAFGRPIRYSAELQGIWRGVVLLKDVIQPDCHCFLVDVSSVFQGGGERFGLAITGRSQTERAAALCFMTAIAG